MESLVIALERLYHEHNENFNTVQRTIGNRIPVGGAHMDIFFKAEALRETLAALRQNKSLDAAIVAGQEASRLAVTSWNNRREWQVHRWVETNTAWILHLVLRLRNQTQSALTAV